MGHAADLITLTTGPLGVLISVAGFAVALWQIRRVRQATEAEGRATQRTAQILTHNQILVLLPDLQRLAQDIGMAVGGPDPDRVVSLLDYWRTTGIRVRGLLATVPGVDDATLAALSRSFTLVTAAKERVRDPNADLVASTKAVRRSIDRVIEDLGDVGGQMLTQAQPEETQ